MGKFDLSKKNILKLTVITLTLIFMIIFLEEVIINWIPYTMVVVSAIGIIILLKKKEAPKPIGFLLATIAGSFIVALGLAMFLPQFGLGMGFTVKDKLTAEQAGSPLEIPINNGRISEAGDYIFYIEPESETMPGDHLIGKLIRRNRDWTHRTELSNTMVSYFMIHNDLIYYSDALQKDYLYSMKLDGSDMSPVIEKSVYACAIEGDYIYYSTIDGLFKSKLGDKESMKLQSKGGYPDIKGDFIYYIDSQDSLYRVNKDGTNDEKLVDGINSCYIGDDTIYFTQLTQKTEGFGYELKLMSCKLDGSNEKEIKTLDNVAQALFSEGSLYCQLLKDDGRVEKGIYRVGLDGSDPERMNKAIMWSWDYILGDWAYALQYSGDRYRIKLDDDIAVRFE